MKQIILGLVRHALTAFGGGLVTHGVLSGDDLQAVIAGLMVVIGVVWSAAEKAGKQ